MGVLQSGRDEPPRHAEWLSQTQRSITHSVILRPDAEGGEERSWEGSPGGGLACEGGGNRESRNSALSAAGLVR